MRKLMVLAALLVLAGCTAEVHLRNARTGATATCGPYVDDITTPEREGRCISDFQRQGFERVAE
jgi:hypothetical protein